MRNTLGMRSLLFASFPDNNLYLYPVVVPLGCRLIRFMFSLMKSVRKEVKQQAEKFKPALPIRSENAQELSLFVPWEILKVKLHMSN